MEIRDRSRSEILLASRPDWFMRLMAIVVFSLILLLFLISGFKGYSGGRWLLYLLLLPAPSFLWQQDVMTRHIHFNRPPGQVTVVYTPPWATAIPGAAYLVKRTVRLPLPREDPKVETRTGSGLDPVGRAVSVFTVWLPTPRGGRFLLYRGGSSTAARDVVSHIRWARRDLIRGGG